MVDDNFLDYLRLNTIARIISTGQRDVISWIACFRPC